MTHNGNLPNGENTKESRHPSLRTPDLGIYSAPSVPLVDHMTGTDWAPFLRVAEVLDLLGQSRSCLYEQIDQRTLPPFVKFGTRTAMWPVLVVDALVRNRMELREGMTHLRQRIVMPHWTTWCPQAPPPVRNVLEDLQLLRLEEVADRLGVSVSTVYRFVRHRGLPGPIPLTMRSRRWIAWEVTRWMSSCVAVSLRISGELPPRASRRKNGRSVPEDRPRR